MRKSISPYLRVWGKWEDAVFLQKSTVENDKVSNFNSSGMLQPAAV